MLDWTPAIDPSDNPTLEELRKDSHAYLAPEV